MRTCVISTNYPIELELELVYAVVEVAQDREQWKAIVQSVTQKYCDLRKSKVIKQREVRKKAEAKREEKK